MKPFTEFELTKEMVNGSLSVFVFILIITGNYLENLCHVECEKN